MFLKFIAAVGSSCLIHSLLPPIGPWNSRTINSLTFPILSVFLKSLASSRRRHIFSKYQWQAQKGDKKNNQVTYAGTYEWILVSFVSFLRSTREPSNSSTVHPKSTSKEVNTVGVQAPRNVLMILRTYIISLWTRQTWGLRLIRQHQVESYLLTPFLKIIILQSKIEGPLKLNLHDVLKPGNRHLSLVWLDAISIPSEFTNTLRTQPDWSGELPR